MKNVLYMSQRLTRKSGYHYYTFGIKEKENKNGSKRQYGKEITKLGQLEDIEDELGINFVTLFKALKEGIYTKPYEQSHINFGKLGAIDYQKKRFRSQRIGGNYYKFKDYGKTWALTKEELE